MPIADIMVEANSIAIATHGRSFYVLDNIEALRQFTPAIASASEPVSVRARAGDSARQPPSRSATGSSSRRKRADDRHPRRDRARSCARTRVAAPDTTKRVPALARTDDDSPRNRQPPPAPMHGGAQHAGVGSPLRAGHDVPRDDPLGRDDERTAGAAGHVLGPPNGGWEDADAPVTVRKNPLLTDVTLADLKEQFDLAIQIRDKVSEANQAVINIRDLKKQTADRLTKSQDPALKTAADSFSKHVSDVEEAIYQVRNQSGQDPLNFPIKINNRLGTLLRTVTTGDGKPIGAARPDLQRPVG